MILNLVDGGDVALAVDLRAPVDPYHISRRLDLLHTAGERTLPTRTDNREVGLVCACDTLARRREDIGPSILHRHQIIPAVRIGYGKNDWLARQIKPCCRPQHIGIRVRDVGRRSVGKRALVRKRVHRRFARRDLSPHVHQHERIRVNVHLLREPLHLLVHRRRNDDPRRNLRRRRLGTAGCKKSAGKNRAGNERSGHARHGGHLRGKRFFTS